MEVTDAWVLIGLKLPATPTQEILDCAKVFLPNTLVLVKLSSEID